MQFSDNLCHFIKMRPSIETIHTANTYSDRRSAGTFSAMNEIQQFQWHMCLICGNYVCAGTPIPTNAMCEDRNHRLFNYNEDLKFQIQYCIKLLEDSDKYGNEELSRIQKKTLLLLSTKLAKNYVMCAHEERELYRNLNKYYG